MCFGLWTGQNSRVGLVTMVCERDTYFPVQKFYLIDCGFDQQWLVMTSYDQLWPVLTSYDQLWPVMTGYDQLILGTTKLNQLWWWLQVYRWQVMRSYGWLKELFASIIYFLWEALSTKKITRVTKYQPSGIGGIYHRLQCHTISIIKMYTRRLKNGHLSLVLNAVNKSCSFFL